jgi:hypothetical protein
MLPPVLAAALAAGSLAACAPGSRGEERVCVTSILREPVAPGNCESGSFGYEWADEDDLDFDKIKKKRKSSTVVKPVVPQPKQPVVVKPPSKPGTGGMGRK